MASKLAVTLAASVGDIASALPNPVVKEGVNSGDLLGAGKPDVVKPYVGVLLSSGGGPSVNR
jgi:hypothetical protein